MVLRGNYLEWPRQFGHSPPRKRILVRREPVSPLLPEFCETLGKIRSFIDAPTFKCTARTG